MLVALKIIGMKKSVPVPVTAETFKKLYFIDLYSIFAYADGF